MSLPAGTAVSTRLQKTDEFLVAMARHALADYAAVEDIEGCE